MIGTVTEALGHNILYIVINRSAIHKCGTKLHVKIAEKVKTQFCGNLPSFVVVRWDGRLFSEKDHCVERLPIFITSTNIEQLIVVPKLECLTGKEQALTICNALQEWGLTNIVEILGCDTTHFTNACVRIETALEKKFPQPTL